MLNHLLQSTLFAVLAGLLTLVLRKNQARARYWLWMAASLKFLLPFALLIGVGGRMGWLKPPMPAPANLVVHPVLNTVEEAAAIAHAAPVRVAIDPIAAIWLCGFLAVVIAWAIRWWRVRAAIAAASPVQLDLGVAALSSPALHEPGVFGILRPVLLLPSGITERLTPEQLRAIVAHELCHIRRRDNLAAASHMIVEALFWFHPLVWWIGARMVEERERACDEEVLRLGNAPVDYAAGILNVCKLYLESPLACVAGVTGGNLQQRIARIASGAETRGLSTARKALLIAAAVLAVIAPIAIGVIDAPRARAQAKLSFEVASVKPSSPSERFVYYPPAVHGHLDIKNLSLKQLVVEAYHIQDEQLAGGPTWLTTDRYDINAKGNDQATQAQVMLMMQTLLADRFHMVVHRETHDMPMYAIVLGKGGVKMPVAEHGDGQFTKTNRSHLYGEGVSVQQLGDMLAFLLKRVVLDKTGLNNLYTIKLDWIPDEMQALGQERADSPKQYSEGASLPSAMQEQLGLRLESRRGPVEVLVIDKAERPTEN